MNASIPGARIDVRQLQYAAIDFPVDILIANVPQRWFLVAGTTSGGAGITIPGDYNSVTNAKYWIQLS